MYASVLVLIYVVTSLLKFCVFYIWCLLPLNRLGLTIAVVIPTGAPHFWLTWRNSSQPQAPHQTTTPHFTVSTITSVTSIKYAYTITGYYIATGVIVGCMVFAAVVLAIILICCCYVCRETEKDKVYIDEVCNLLLIKT